MLLTGRVGCSLWSQVLFWLLLFSSGVVGPVFLFWVIFDDCISLFSYLFCTEGGSEVFLARGRPALPTLSYPCVLRRASRRPVWHGHRSGLLHGPWSPKWSPRPSLGNLLGPNLHQTDNISPLAKNFIIYKTFF